MQRLNITAGLIAAAATLTAVPAHAQGSTAPAAASSVTVYGLIDAVVRRADNVKASTSDAVTTMEDGLITGSRLGFRGVEDLGGGWRAGFLMESGFDPSNGTSLQGTTTADYGQEAVSPRFWGRDLYLNLRNNWGGVTLGRQYTVAHLIAARFQPQGNPNNLALSVFSSHHVARQDNMLRLDTKVAGIDVQASRTFGEQAGSSSANASWALGAVYAGDGYALGGYVQQMENRAGTEERRIVGVGGNYRFHPVFALFGGYMQRSAEVSPQENKVWTLGANVELGSAVTLSLAHYDDAQSGSAALEGTRQVSWVTASYRFSRRTDVYALVDHNKVVDGYAKPAFMGTLGNQTAMNVGLRHRF
jgi:predicted porin